MDYTSKIKGYAGVIQAYALAEQTHERLTGDAWSVFAGTVGAALKEGKTVEAIKAEVLAAEDQWKSATGIGTMPVAYRGAKSVAFKAIANGIPLIGEDGAPKGKSAVHKEAKAKEDADAAEIEELMADGGEPPAYTTLILTMQAQWPKLTPSERESAWLEMQRLYTEGSR